MPPDAGVRSSRLRLKGQHALRLSRPSSYCEEDQSPRRPPSPKQARGDFAHAHDFVLNRPVFVEHAHNAISTGKAVFETLEPYAMLSAVKDSSARYPPPRCHDGTRLAIRNRLKDWLYDPDGCKAVWVRGAAGTGKSTVAQSFADSCGDWRRLGGTYFFSKIAGRDKLETVIPTLVYQLAITLPEFKSLVACELANNPLLLRNSPPVQFKKLILEPLSIIQRKNPCDPLVIILDGLDECKGEDPQLEILQLISDAIHSKPDVPIRWLICSRPEVHLNRAFSKMPDCIREELIVDAEYRDDVERYVRARVTKIKTRYGDITTPDWPSEDQVRKLIDGVSGLFVLASTSLDYVEDHMEVDPSGRMDYLLTFLQGTRAVGLRNPLAALDLFYTRILLGIPSGVFPTTRRILAHLFYTRNRFRGMKSTKVLCNFLGLDRWTFYRAVRGLHSVMRIPDPEDAGGSLLRVHHASFQDFLRDPNRSGEFAIEKQQALVDVAKTALHWYTVDTTHFHTNNGDFDPYHKHGSLPGLTWVTTEDDRLSTSQEIARFVDLLCWHFVFRLAWADVDKDLLSQIYNFDFRYCNPQNIDHLANWFFRRDPSNTFVRTKPSSPTDSRLLEYFNLVIGHGIAQPAAFPLKWTSNDRLWVREYFIIGHGIKSVIVWITRSPGLLEYSIHSLSSDQEPTNAQIYEYRESLRMIKWDEGEAVGYTSSKDRILVSVQ